MTKKRKVKKRRKKKFTGNARALMMLKGAIRRLWRMYGENRPYNLKKEETKCVKCEDRATEWDHIEPVGTRFYTPEEIPAYWIKMFEGPTQPMCTICNRKKGKKNEK